ncbi:MAG: hypothetical protein PHW74_13265 [Desulfobacca sp.]|nr:hypothetical protein [Desulfobacca sp.]
MPFKDEQLQDIFAAINDVRWTLNQLAQPLTALTGSVSLMLLEQDHESGDPEVLQAINNIADIIRNILVEIWKMVEALITRIKLCGIDDQKQEAECYTLKWLPKPSVRMTKLNLVRDLVKLMLLDLEKGARHYQELREICWYLERIIQKVDEFQQKAPSES